MVASLQLKQPRILTPIATNRPVICEVNNKYLHKHDKCGASYKLMSRDLQPQEEITHGPLHQTQS